MQAASGLIPVLVNVGRITGLLLNCNRVSRMYCERRRRLLTHESFCEEESTPLLMKECLCLAMNRNTLIFKSPAKEVNIMTVNRYTYISRLHI
jgi:hypothetical protein